MTKTHTISPARLTIDRACELVEGGYTLHLGDKAVELITKCREYLDRKIESTTEPLYGITVACVRRGRTRVAGNCEDDAFAEGSEPQLR